MESAEPNQQFCLRWNNHLGNMVNVFEDLFQKESFTDVNIVVQDGLYLKCHKLVLAACSSYFRKIFCNIPEQQPTILLKDITYTQMKAILEYMYKGHTSIPSEELPNLLCIGEWLKIKGLVNTEAENEVSQTSKLNRKRNNTESSASLSPDICTSTATQNQLQNPDGNGHSSPPHSTSSSTFYGRSPISRGAYDSRIPSTWSSPYTGHNYSSLQQQASSLSAQHTSYFASQYEALGSQSKLMNYLPRNDPILRRVLDKGHVDSSQGVAAVAAAAAAAAALPLVQPDPVPDYHTTASNGSASDNLDLRRSSIEHPQPHSSYDNLDEPEKKRPAKSTDLNKSQQKPEWKRYKQYSKSDITSAIEAVRGGMSALQASRKFHVPSRTLYDKVKKLGVGGPRTNRTRSSQSNSDSGKFPLNVGHNINGNIYGSLSAHNERGLMDEAASLLHSAFVKSRDNSTDGEGGMIEAPEDSSSPPPSMHPGYGIHHSMDDEVEDLSIKSKTEPRLMMSPTIKDEVPDAPEDFSRASS